MQRKWASGGGEIYLFFITESLPAWATMPVLGALIISSTRSESYTKIVKLFIYVTFQSATQCCRTQRGRMEMQRGVSGRRILVTSLAASISFDRKSVVDPDQNWSRIQNLYGSVIRIRIRIQTGKYRIN